MNHESRRARRRARLLRTMLRATLAAGVALLAMTTMRVPAAPAAHPPATIPATFHGIWQPDTRKGRAACTAYRKADPESDESVWALTGAVIVHADVVHEVSDMGEGDFISVDRLTFERAGVLRVDGRLGIDTLADETSDPTTVRLRRTGDTLELRETFKGDTTRDVYRYCAPVPRD